MLELELESVKINATFYIWAQAWNMYLHGQKPEIWLFHGVISWWHDVKKQIGSSSKLKESVISWPLAGGKY